MGQALSFIIPFIALATNMLQKRGQEWVQTPGINVNELAERNRVLAEQVRQLQEHNEQMAKHAQELSKVPRAGPKLSAEQLADIKRRIGLNPDRYNFAVSGESGKGKSSITNALAGKTVCKVGEIETTMDPQEIKITDTVSFWDLPGGGTKSFPSQDYVERFGLKAFDAVLLVTDNRFTEFDVALRSILHDAGVPVFLVRNKADLALQSKMDRGNFDENTPAAELMALQKSVREEITKSAMENFKTVVPLYIVSARHMQFPRRNVYVLPTIYFDESKLLADVSMAGSARARGNN